MGNLHELLSAAVLNAQPFGPSLAGCGCRLFLLFGYLLGSKFGRASIYISALRCPYGLGYSLVAVSHWLGSPLSRCHLTPRTKWRNSRESLWTPCCDKALMPAKSLNAKSE